MDFTYVEFPSTVDLNTFKAYFNLADVKLPKIQEKNLQTGDTFTGGEINTNQTKSLRHLVLDAIIENWIGKYGGLCVAEDKSQENATLFVFEDTRENTENEIPRQEDRNYILSNLDVNLPLQLLSTHIRDDFFWRKCFQQRWRAQQQQQEEDTQLAQGMPQMPYKQKPWINSYMERHLQEFMEKLETADYDQESVQLTLDICGAYINQLVINHLQPTLAAHAMDGRNDHIPLDFILSNLPELHTLRLTFCTKTVGTAFYLGCNTLSQRDIIFLARGLSRCHELVDFCLHNTKLEAYQLRFIARSLDKGCHNLHTLSLVHCGFGDDGIRQFLESCNKESFSNLKILDLTNNKISAEGAYILSRTLSGIKLAKLMLRLNPICSDGAGALCSMLNNLPLRYLDLSGCSLDEKLTKIFMQLIIQNRTILHLDISNNPMGEEFGKHLYKIIGFNKTIEYFDIRNTNMSMEMRNKFKAVIQKNICRSKKLKIKN